jgi:hypothetical protein
MPKKQPNPPFGTDTAAPDNVPMNTNGMVRGTVNARQGKLKVARAGNATATANPYAGSSWDEHESLLGF